MGAIPYREMVFTGPVDQFFDYCYGKLPYRSLEFKHETIDQEQVLPVAVVNYPNEHPYTRVTEFKQLTGQQHQKSGIVYEYPRSEGDPYYPIPKPECSELYNRYKELADRTPGVTFVGRLATYKYYNMDQVVAQALATFDKLQGTKRERVILHTETAPLPVAPKSGLTVPSHGVPASVPMAAMVAATNGNGSTAAALSAAPAGKLHDPASASRLAALLDEEEDEE
jgi:hypothetical protein